MTRYIGIKNNNIYVVSDSIFTSNSFNVIELPASLNSISSKEIISNFKYKNGLIIPKNINKSSKDLRVALVSNFKMKCGIATYAESLFGEIIKKVGDYKLFIEKNDNPTGPLNIVNGMEIPTGKIISCWKRGESLKELVKEIKSYDPDIVFIQHEFGIWPNARYWLSLMNQLSQFRIIVTMHSVFHHRDKTIIEAAIPEIVVHLEGAKKVLKEEKGVSGKVYVIPHGTAECVDRSKLWNFYKSERTFLQFGFGFRYKNIENCIKATAALKEKYNDIFFTNLFSESPFNKDDHEIYYNELMELVEKLGVEENVAIIRGYQSDTSLDAYLRTNQATIFPYVSGGEHEVFGVSGTARMAMAKGLPVITSNANHFSDLPTIKADSVEEISAALDLIFSDGEFKENQIKRQISYLSETSWEKVANKYIDLFENIIIT